MCYMTFITTRPHKANNVFRKFIAYLRDVTQNIDLS